MLGEMCVEGAAVERLDTRGKVFWALAHVRDRDGRGQKILAEILKTNERKLKCHLIVKTIMSVLLFSGEPGSCCFPIQI